jgi:uncharacterized protein YycO
MIARLIKWQSRGPFSHGSVLLDDNTVIESVAGDGVRRVSLATYADQYAAGLIMTAVLDLTDAEYARAVDFLESQLGKPYDYWGAIQFVTRGKQSNRHSRRWFCTELVYQMLVELGRPCFNRTQAWEVSPTLLGRAPQLTFV